MQDLLNKWFAFVNEHEALVWWLGIGSLVMFLGTLIAIPIIVARIPEDYFTRKSRHDDAWKPSHPALRLTVVILKNLAGVLFILAGIPMLLGPGQGVLAILIGIMLLDFPGKYRFERSIIRRRPVHRTINWIRAKADRPPLKIPKEEHALQG
jgi:hypothetical protein